jgi:Nitrile hydratase, alpha chain
VLLSIALFNKRGRAKSLWNDLAIEAGLRAAHFAPRRNGKPNPGVAESFWLSGVKNGGSLIFLDGGRHPQNPERSTMSENDNDFGKIVAKAWRDPAFKAELIANPAAALKAEGIDVPAGMTVTVVENTDKQFHLVLPPVPTDELCDEALDAVAGGVWSKACRPGPSMRS